MGLHISRLEIKNYRNFASLIVDPFPPNAVITGENGTGKTNLLRAIRLVLDPSLPDSARMLESTDIWDGDPVGVAGGTTVEVILEFQGYDDNPDAKSSLSKCHVAFSPYTARITYRFQLTQNAKDALDDAKAKGESGEAKISDYDFVILGGADELIDVRSMRREIAMRVLPALRNAETDLTSWRRNPLKDILAVLPIDASRLEAAADAASKAIDELRKDPNIAKLEDGLHTRLRDMAGPRLPVKPALGFASTHPSELTKAVRLYIDAGRVRDVGAASLGTANLLYLGLLIEAIEYQRKSLQFVTMVLGVEEPEAHLHVTLQRRLFRYLLREDSGIILTTHSPHIVAVSPLSSLVVLKEVEGEGTVAATASNASLAPDEVGDLERYMDVTRAEVLFARYVILVEGAAELFVLPSLAVAAGLDLDSYGVVVSSVNGTDFAPYCKLLGPSGLDIPHAVVTDGDVGPDAKGRREAGVKRAVKLLPPGRARDSLSGLIEKLVTDEKNGEPAETTLPLRRKIVDDLATFNIFVGEETLEVDLCQAFGAEITESFADLSRVEKARSEVSHCVDLEIQGTPEKAARSDFLARIGVVGKGRFGQRLASYLQAIDMNGLLSDFDLDGEPKDAVARSIPGCSHIFQAIDAASRHVRGIGIFEEESP